MVAETCDIALAAAAAYLGYRKFAVTVLVVCNALWLLVSALEKRTRAWCWSGVLGALIAVVITWLVLTRPGVEIMLPSAVSRTTAVELKYGNISLDKRLWLVIKGKTNFWPVGTCDLETGSLIEQTRLSLKQKSGEWAYSDLVLGAEGETGEGSMLPLPTAAATSARIFFLYKALKLRRFAFDGTSGSGEPGSENPTV